MGKWESAKTMPPCWARRRRKTKNQEQKSEPGIALIGARCAVFFAALCATVAACGGGGEGADPETDPTSTPAAPRPSPPSAGASPSPTVTLPPAPTPELSTAPAQPTGPTEPTAAPAPAPSVSLLSIVDKQHALPAGYVPPDLVALDAGQAAPGFGGLLLTGEANRALASMLAAAAAAGHDIRVRSAYRSYAEQERTFAYWVSVLGEAEARRVSAEAGHSEHQLGTTVDLTAPDVGYDLTEAFSETPAGGWLLDNSHLYGFALSYPAGAEAVTGYAYEPWHYRYIGLEHAAAWKGSAATLAEYLRGL